jgi:periplasmic protein TonB
MSDMPVIDQLDEGIEALLARTDSELPVSNPTVAELLALAAELRSLPNPEFKAFLKADLGEQAATGHGVHAHMNSRTAEAIRPARDAERDTTPPPEILPTLSDMGHELYPVQRSSFMVSLMAHATAFALLVTSGIWAAQGFHERPRVSSIVVTDISPSTLPPALKRAGGGGGGGDSDKLQASKGIPPRFAREQVTPPAIVVRSERPKLPAEATVVGPPSLSFPPTSQMGDPYSGVFAPPSNGTGSSGGMGSGSRGGVGPGTGPGVGVGWGGGIGGGPYLVGGGVSAPHVIYDPEPEYSEEARKAKYQGVVVLQVVVGADGRPRDVRVARSLGLGLDEKALEAVRQWRFDPGMMNGRPVAVVVNVEVSFRLY